MVTTRDVEAYLGRLRVEHADPPSVEGLYRVHRAHVEHVPYETAWIHLGERWDVDRAASLQRIAHGQRGGYCFHLNGALSLLLEALGYDVSLHIGGVHGPDGPASERMDNHLVLVVHGLPDSSNPGGDWYVDAGLGDALHEPLPLVAGTYRQGPFEFALTASDVDFADWCLHHHPLGSFSGMAFRAEPVDISAFAARNIELSTSPDSGFVQNLVVQRRDATGVDLLRGLMLRRIEDTVITERELADPTEWFQVMSELFELPVRTIAPAAADDLWTRTSDTHHRWRERTATAP